MRVLGFGTYDSISHPRVGIILAGLRAGGDEVVELNRPLGFSTAERVEILHRPWLAYRPVLRLLWCWVGLTVGRFRLRRCEAVVVGYLGHFDVVLARILFPRQIVVLDLLIFAADTAADRGVRRGMKLRLLALLDRLAIACADRVLVDTDEHAAMVPIRARPKTYVVEVGAPSSWFADPRDRALGDPIRVVFFGLFTPLQGAPVIGEALTLLNTPMRITMIGNGQDLQEAKRLAAGATVDIRWQDWVGPHELPAIVAGHDVCLGIFAASGKGVRVTPNKVFQGAAAGCAIVTSDTPPQRRTLGDAAMYVTPGSPSALADALSCLAAHPESIVELRRQAYARAVAAFAPERIGQAARVAIAGGAGRTSDGSRPRPNGDAMPGPKFVPLAPNAIMRWAVVRAELDRIRPLDTVEMGCGQGGFGARIAARGGAYVGVEPDPQSSAVARTRVEPFGGSVITGTASDLPESRKFDLLCAFEVLEHLEDDLGHLTTWSNLLKPGGCVLVSVPAWPHRFAPWDKHVGHFRRYTPQDLDKLLGNAGFDQVRTRVYGWPLGYLTENVRNVIAARRDAPDKGGQEESMEVRTASSGRLLQPKTVLAELVRVGTVPFVQLQKLRPRLGTGLVGVGRLPSDGGRENR